MENTKLDIFSKGMPPSEISEEELENRSMSR